MTSVGIVGAGIGAATAAHCLANRGIAVSWAGQPAGQGAPLVMLGDQAQILLRDVFAGHAALGAELDQAHRITRRIVRWGSDEAHAVPHSALVIAGDRLSAALQDPQDATTIARKSPLPEGGGLGGGVPGPGKAQPIELRAPNPSPNGEGLPSCEANDLTLTTLAPATSTLLHFGQREATAAPVVLQPHTDPHAALIEATAHGWLFLIPTSAQSGWLLTVGATPDEALRESRLVASAVAETGAISRRFETAPRILETPASPGALTIGTAALALDPICGDGVATAVRGGILAAAVAAEFAQQSPLDRSVLIGHYRAMLIAAMRRHLAVSSPFYERGGQGPWWREQAEAIALGHAWCTRQLAAAGEAQFVLAGDRLVMRDRVA